MRSRGQGIYVGRSRSASFIPREAFVCGLRHYHSLSPWHTGYFCRFKLLQREERSEPGSPRSSVSAVTFQPLGEDGERGPPSLTVPSVGTRPAGMSKIGFTSETGTKQVLGDRGKTQVWSACFAT